MSRLALRLEAVGKSYSQRPTLASHFLGLCFWRKPKPPNAWALKEVSFEVEAGSAVGIIGLNGSGKTTLLEIIAGTLKPTAGTVARTGRISALLELSSGFDPELSGRENIFLNGMVSGLSRGLIDQNLEAIIQFADLGDVLDMPVKTYSSGMLARLAFSLHTVLVPDILIIDEILAVGDYFFQQKCYRRLAQLREAGVTILFVSHDLSLVRDMCQRAVYLKAGRLEYSGPSDIAIHRLMTDDSNKQNNVTPVSNTLCQASLDQEDAVWHREASGNGRLSAVRIVDRQGRSSLSHALGEMISIQVWFRTFPEDDDLIIGLAIKNRYDQTVTSTNSVLLKCPRISHEGEGWRSFEFNTELLLEGGEYSLTLGLNRKPTVGESGNQSLDTTGWFGPLRVVWDYHELAPPFLGMFGLPIVGKLDDSL